jgi:hypothetical protein
MKTHAHIPSPSVARGIAILLGAVFVGIAPGAASAQCRLYRRDAVAVATPTGDEVCATVSCDAPNDLLVSCGLGPQTTLHSKAGFEVLRIDNTTCKACSLLTVQVEATCIAAP